MRFGFLTRSVLACVLALSGSGLRAQDESRTPRLDREGSILGPVGGRELQNLGTYHALLIGIEKYPKFDGRDLRTPVQDVNRLERALIESYGFAPSRITKLVNEEATRDGILRALAQYSKAGLSKQDSLFIYFAGHGISDGNQGYWIPSDGRPGEEYSWISGPELKNTFLKKVPAKHILLVSDSCYAGALTRRLDVTASESERKDEGDGFIGKILAKASYEMMTSGGLQPVTDGGFEGCSMFAHLFCRLLESNEETYLPSYEIYSKLVKQVYSATRDGTQQQMERARIDGMPDDRGHFVFVRVEGAKSLNLKAPPKFDDLPPGWVLPDKVVRIRPGLFRSTGNDATEMVCVWPSEFEMQGRSIRVRTPFLMDREEVTVGRFGVYIKAVDKVPDGMRLWGAKGYSDDPLQAVAGVSLQDARAFARWAGRQLPTEPEWICAAAFDRRTKRLRRFPWGDDPSAIKLPQQLERPPLVSRCRDAGDISPWGVSGMGSGLREWCELEPLQEGSGVVCGATSVAAERRPLHLLALDDKRFSLPQLAGNRSNAVGFRCIMHLRRG